MIFITVFCIAFGDKKCFGKFLQCLDTKIIPYVVTHEVCSSVTHAIFRMPCVEITLFNIETNKKLKEEE